MTAPVLIRLLIGTALLGFAMAATLTCPPGFDEHLGRCYKLNVTHTRWKEARARCILEGAKLVEPRSQQEFDLIKNHFGEAVSNIWLGISDLDTEGIFVYDSDGGNLTYENWSIKQPDNWQGKEDCVHFQAANAGLVAPMNDIDCNTHWFSYICQTEKRSSQCASCPLSGYCPLTTHKCYKLVEDGTTWIDAVRACNSEAPNIAKLAEPRNKLEFDLFDNIFGGIGNNIWLGISDRSKEGMFVYQSDGSALTYPNWAVKQPDDWQENEDCVHFQAPGGRVAPMNDLDCNTDWYSHVCQTDISSSLGELNRTLVIGQTFGRGFTPMRTTFGYESSISLMCNSPPPYPRQAIRFNRPVSTFIGGKALVCGGTLRPDESSISTVQRECFFFDGCNGGWMRGPDLPEGRQYARGVMLDEKRWWILGGSKTNFRDYQNNTWVYHADTGIFEPYKDIPAPMVFFCATKVGPNKIFIHRTFPRPTKSWLFDINTEQFSEVPNNADDTITANCGTITLADGTQEVLVQIGSKKFEIFSPITMQWRDGPTLIKVPRFAFNLGRTFYLTDSETQLWKFNVSTMEFERGLNTLGLFGVEFLSTVVPVPESFTVCEVRT